jgi:hypothetical protein
MIAVRVVTARRRSGTTSRASISARRSGLSLAASAIATVRVESSAIGSSRRRVIPTNTSHAAGPASVMASAPVAEPISARITR